MDYSGLGHACAIDWNVSRRRHEGWTRRQISKAHIRSTIHRSHWCIYIYTSSYPLLLSHRALTLSPHPYRRSFLTLDIAEVMAWKVIFQLWREDKIDTTENRVFCASVYCCFAEPGLYCGSFFELASDFLSRHSTQNITRIEYGCAVGHTI